MKFLILILLLSQTTLAQDVLKLREEELHPETQDILIKRPEQHLRHESMIYDLNTDLGIKDQRKYTGEDRNKFAIAGHLSGDYEHFNDILGLEFNYMRRTEQYDQMWYGLQLFKHNTFFDSITKNQKLQTGDDTNADSRFQRPNNVKNGVMGLGLGAGYRFKLLLDFFPTEDVFESIDVYANYVTLNETYIKQTYKGYGLTTNYGIHKRSSTKYFYGGKLSYNLATVTRAALGNESKSERSFALGWLSLAFEIGFFY